nr:AlNc14C9G1123 [Albugo laibachii Nc14]|eukprot:CCA15130.1 AlNc14C9G1123 [Albugo laibachii Nc14]
MFLKEFHPNTILYHYLDSYFRVQSYEINGTGIVPLNCSLVNFKTEISLYITETLLRTMQHLFE